MEYTLLPDGIAMISDNQNPGQKGRKDDLIFLLVLLALSLSLNVFLGVRLHRMKGFSRSPASAILPEGAEVLPLKARSLGGQDATIGFSGTGSLPTVLYIMSASCAYCAENRRNIGNLVRLRGNSYRFIGLMLSRRGTFSEAEVGNVGFPVFADLSPESWSALKIAGTPQTIVISPEARVLKNWVGSYTGGIGAEVESWFSVTFQSPGSTD